MHATPSETIEIVVNGEPKQVPEGLAVDSLLRHLDIPAGRVAVELDRNIVRKQDWSTTVIASGAQVEVVWFVGGGSQE